MAGDSISLRGEWITFVQMVLVLVFRYVTRATAGPHPALNGNLTWRLSTGFIATTL